MSDYAQTVVECQQAIRKNWQPQFLVDDQWRAVADNTHTFLMQDTAAEGRRVLTEPVVARTGIGPRDVKRLGSLYPQPAAITFEGEGLSSELKSEKLEQGYEKFRERQNPFGNSPRQRSSKNLIVAGRAPWICLPGDKYWWDTPRFKEAGYTDETDEQYNRRREYWERKSPTTILYRDLSPWTTFPVTLARLEDEVLSFVITSWAELGDIFSEQELAGVSSPTKSSKDWHNNCCLAYYATRDIIGYYVLKSGDWNPTQSMAVSAWREMDFTKADLVREVQHGLGKVPIRITSVPGDSTEPGRCWKGIFADGVVEQIKLIDGRFSDAHTAVRKGVNQPLTAHLNQNDGEDQAAQIKRVFGPDLFVLDPGDGMAGGRQREDIAPVAVPNGAADAMTLIQDMERRVAQMTGATETLWGNPDLRNITAWAANLNVQVDTKGLSELTRAHAEMDLEIAAMSLLCIAEFGEDVRLTPEIVIKATTEGDKKALRSAIPTLKAEYKPEIPSDSITRMQVGVQLMEASLRAQSPLPIPLDLIMHEWMGIDQPMDAITDWVRYRTLLSAPYLDSIAKSALDEMDVLGAQEENMSLAEYMAQHPNGQGIPPEIHQMIMQKAQEQGAAPPATNGANPLAPPMNVPFSHASPSVAGMAGMPR